MSRGLAALTIAVLLISCTTSLFGGPFGFGKKAEGVQWQHDLRAAHKIAVAQNKPMLIVFGADWCGFCKKLEKETLGNQELATYINESFIPVHLDADKDEKILEILGVKGLPCTIVLSPAAEEIARIDGFHQPSGFYQKIAQAKLDFQKVKAASASR